jgi:pyridoxal phosphate enzyme (YggS family)
MTPLEGAAIEGGGAAVERAGTAANELDPSAVAERVASARERVRRAGGSERVTIVAVTKGFGPEAVGAAASAGLGDIGENYAQEMLSKIPSAPAGLRWHFLGEMQRKKLARLAPYVYLWHGLDRVEEAACLAKVCPGARVLIEVRAAGASGGRPGVSLGAVPELVAVARRAGLDVRGLMTVAAPGATIGEVASHFHQVASLAHELGLAEVSMGMSADFELAVAQGATIVRLGTALFGPRPHH